MPEKINNQCNNINNTKRFFNQFQVEGRNRKHKKSHAAEMSYETCYKYNAYKQIICITNEHLIRYGNRFRVGIEPSTLKISSSVSKISRPTCHV